VLHYSVDQAFHIERPAGSISPLYLLSPT
jgi:hypothetical protein